MTKEHTLDVTDTMRRCRAWLESLTPYSQSGFLRSQKGPKETHEEFEERCWRERMHVVNGSVVIPQMALKYAIDEACKRLAIQVPGEGKTRYTKYFEAGYYVESAPVLNIDPENVAGEWLWCSSDGKKGKAAQGKVQRCYPIFPEWKTVATFVIYDDKIPADIFERCLVAAGIYVCLGRFRAENQGTNGKFRVTKTGWS
jgi:hypothetical protein